MSGFDAAPTRETDLTRARDAIADRFGTGAITRARLVHEPDCREEEVCGGWREHECRSRSEG